jgi:peptidoglycan hydrolase-like protein with peptidoglycan-binding domain
MTARYAVGYSGAAYTLAQLQRWRHFERLDDEFARRILALMDASIAAGTPVGIGSSIRTTEGQTRLFLSRHHPVASGGCCTWDGRRWALNKGVAHAAPPGRSYHEDSVLPSGKCLAADLIGSMRFVGANAQRFGLREFSKVNNEPWHVQPWEIPSARRSFRLAAHYPLKVWPLPQWQAPRPSRVEAPKPSLYQGNANDRGEVRELQAMCNFFGWRDAYGRELLVDGDYGQNTAAAVTAMQEALAVKRDGIYGPVTAAKFQAFLDEVSS